VNIAGGCLDTITVNILYPFSQVEIQGVFICQIAPWMMLFLKPCNHAGGGQASWLKDRKERKDFEYNNNGFNLKQMIYVLYALKIKTTLPLN